MDNQDTFLNNIRTALGKAPGIKRSKTTFPELFSSTNTDENMQKIRKRTVVEQDLLVEILQKNGELANGGVVAPTHRIEPNVTSLTDAHGLFAVV